MTAGNAAGPKGRTGGVKAGVSVSAAPSKASSAKSQGRPVPGVAVPPAAPPPFSIADVRAALPAHLFERSAFWGFVHLGMDLVKAAALWGAMYALDTSALPLAVKAVAWPVLWYALGAVLTGVWVIAHECGHQSFSAYRWLNDAVGLVLVRSAGRKGGGGGREGAARNRARFVEPRAICRAAGRHVSGRARRRHGGAPAVPPMVVGGWPPRMPARDAAASRGWRRCGAARWES